MSTLTHELVLPLGLEPVPTDGSGLLCLGSRQGLFHTSGTTVVNNTTVVPWDLIPGSPYRLHCTFYVSGTIDSSTALTSSLEVGASGSSLDSLPGSAAVSVAYTTSSVAGLVYLYSDPLALTGSSYVRTLHSSLGDVFVDAETVVVQAVSSSFRGQFLPGVSTHLFSGSGERVLRQWLVNFPLLPSGPLSFVLSGKTFATAGEQLRCRVLVGGADAGTGVVDGSAAVDATFSGGNSGDGHPSAVSASFVNPRTMCLVKLAARSVGSLAVGLREYAVSIIGVDEEDED